MNHEHYQQLVSEFIDREISGGDEQELFAHLNSCGECREFLKATLSLQGQIRETKPAYNVSPRSGRTGTVLRTLWTKRVPMSVAAVLAVVALASTVTLSTLWMRPKEKAPETNQEVVYVTRMPAIQVIGFYSPNEKSKK
jgi:predicted anti-sigma-YlaC factor YlaD